MEVSADKRDTVVEIAKELVKHSLQDNGCIAYDLYESATRHNTLMICETWNFKRLVPQLEELSNMKLEKFNF